MSDFGLRLLELFLLRWSVARCRQWLELLLVLKDLRIIRIQVVYQLILYLWIPFFTRSFFTPGFLKCLNSKWRRKFLDCLMTAWHIGQVAGCSDWDLALAASIRNLKSNDYFENLTLILRKRGPMKWLIKRSTFWALFVLLLRSHWNLTYRYLIFLGPGSVPMRINYWLLIQHLRNKKINKIKFWNLVYGPRSHTMF